ncbi:MAG: pyridoxal-dependent decarboxylase [Gammaproteobacteria bacterium]|nr:pyridoxal-dependent decarboxylase [Gammaproteobacteria bacterium]
MAQPSPRQGSEQSLDPQDWTALRSQGHRMLDDMLDYLEGIRERPVWQPMPDAVRQRFDQPLPRQSAALGAVHETFQDSVLPYALGNTHPRFMGWVHGGGTAVGMLAEMLAAGLNANLGGREQAPLAVERQVLRWVRELFGFPDSASGLFVTGTSMANFIAVLVARTGTLGRKVLEHGIAGDGLRLRAYTSAAAHNSLARAMNLCGLGTDALRIVPVDHNHRMDIDALVSAIRQDRDAGFTPFFVAATAGTVDVGAIDELNAVAEVVRRERLWFHVDGACGALGMLAADIAPRLAGIEQADSIAFDFHKWGQVPYDAGFVLVRDGRLHYDTFATPAPYLGRARRGMAAGSPWPCDFGPDLSRGFRALKTWFTISVYGADRLGRMISGCCERARYLERRIETEPELELLAPVSLNIVCFRFRCNASDTVNADIVADLQESGLAAPSTTLVSGRLAIRAAIVNHRTADGDMDSFVDATLRLGRHHDTHIRRTHDE